MPKMSYGRALAWLARRDPDWVAIVHDDETTTRIALEHHSNRLAQAYAQLGVREGDLVTIALTNGIEFFEACLASWKLGVTRGATAECT